MRLNTLITVSGVLLTMSTSLQSAGAGPTDEPPQLTATTIVADLDQESVHRLREAGEILSLEEIIERVRQKYPGRIIEIELDNEEGNFVYELEIVDDTGTVFEIDVDATTGDILKYERDS